MVVELQARFSVGLCTPVYPARLQQTPVFSTTRRLTQACRAALVGSGANKEKHGWTGGHHSTAVAGPKAVSLPDLSAGCQPVAVKPCYRVYMMVRGWICCVGCAPSYNHSNSHNSNIHVLCCAGSPHRGGPVSCGRTHCVQRLHVHSTHGLDDLYWLLAEPAARPLRCCHSDHTHRDQLQEVSWMQRELYGLRFSYRDGSEAAAGQLSATSACSAPRCEQIRAKQGATPDVHHCTAALLIGQGPVMTPHCVLWCLQSSSVRRLLLRRVCAL